MFKGTTVEIANGTLYDAAKPAYLLQTDGQWHKVPENQPKAFVSSFRAYFQASGASATRALLMEFKGAETSTLKTAPKLLEESSKVLQTVVDSVMSRLTDWCSSASTVISTRRTSLWSAVLTILRPAK